MERHCELAPVRELVGRPEPMTTRVTSAGYTHWIHIAAALEGHSWRTVFCNTVLSLSTRERQKLRSVLPLSTREGATKQAEHLTLSGRERQKLLLSLSGRERRDARGAQFLGRRMNRRARRTMRRTQCDGGAQPLRATKAAQLLSLSTRERQNAPLPCSCACFVALESSASKCQRVLQVPESSL